MDTVVKSLIFIGNIFLIFIFFPLSWMVEIFGRPLAIVWIVLKNASCSTFRHALAVILCIQALPIFFLIFGVWGIVQVSINTCKYFEGPKKYQVTLQNILEYFWAKNDPMFNLIIRLFGTIRGVPFEIQSEKSSSQNLGHSNLATSNATASSNIKNLEVKIQE